MLGLRRIDLGLVMALVVGVPGAAFARTDPTPAVHGDVQVRAGEGADFAAVADGAPIVAGTVVRAGASGVARIDVSDGVSVRLSPGAVVTVRAFSWLPPEHPGAQPVRALQLALGSGEIDVTAPMVHDPAKELGLTITMTNNRSVALWRGAANITLSPDESATVAVYQGMGIAGSGTGWKPLAAGKAVVLGAKGEALAKAIPGIPTWADASSTVPAFAIVRGNSGGVVGTAWTATPDAASYRVELAHDATMSGPVTVTSTTAPSFKTDPVAPGTYAVRVRAVSAEGIVGQPSTPKVLRIARFTLPSGATVAPDGTVVLSATSAVHFDDPRDIEVATVVNHGAPDDVLFWAPASADLTLGPADRREVRIRNAATHVEATVMLVRRDLRAHVSFTPKPARWPSDAIDIRVKLEDPSGYVDPTKESIKVETRVDIDAADLHWSHAGDTWTARLPPQTKGPGPWVVRVEVRDASGQSIGASLLDVDGPGGDPSFQQAAYRR
jgi:hypothetical protein